MGAGEEALFDSKSKKALWLSGMRAEVFSSYILDVFCSSDRNIFLQCADNLAEQTQKHSSKGNALLQKGISSADPLSVLKA